MILGVDEVGRGCWAGPLVMGAVVLGYAKIDGLADSKILSKKRRVELAREIHEKAADVALGWVDASEIDELGLGESLRLACRRAVGQISVSHSEIIIDGTVNFLANTRKAPYVSVLKKADLLIREASAASIVAKVARDEFMARQDEIFPGYGFKNHVGYGTAAHRLAIEKKGACELHRLSFGPLKKYAKEQNSHTTKAKDKTTKSIGDEAESKVASKLELLGHRVLARNWRTKWCEIDIVSMFENELYFTEVKYRKDSSFGGGLEAVTAKKQRQIRFAVEIFLIKNPKFANLQANLLAADVSGDPPEVQQLVEV